MSQTKLNQLKPTHLKIGRINILAGKSRAVLDVKLQLVPLQHRNERRRVGHVFGLGEDIVAGDVTGVEAGVVGGLHRAVTLVTLLEDPVTQRPCGCARMLGNNYK